VKYLVFSTYIKKSSLVFWGHPHIEQTQLQAEAMRDGEAALEKKENP